MFWKKKKNEYESDADIQREKERLDEELAKVRAKKEAILRKKNATGNSSSDYNPSRKVVKTDARTHLDIPEQRSDHTSGGSENEVIQTSGAKNRLHHFWYKLRHAFKWKKNNTAFSPPVPIVNLWRKLKGKQLTRREKAKMRYHFYFVLFVLVVVIWGFCLMAFK